MSETIEFIKVESAGSSFLKVVPAIKSIPLWYRAMEPLRMLGHGKSICGVDDGDGRDFTVKKCIPVLDALTTGYLLETRFDLFFSKDEESNQYSFSYKPDGENVENYPITMHPYEQIRDMPLDGQFHEYAFKFSNPYLIKTPPGYSCIFSHPHNSFYAFHSFTGVVDTDLHPLAVQFPFLMRKNWEGVIPKGTAIIQITPFKRDDWKMRISEVPNKLDRQQSEAAFMSFEQDRYDENGKLVGGWYKKRFRTKKRYY